MTRNLPSLQPALSTNDDDYSPTGYLHVQDSEPLVDLPWPWRAAANLHAVVVDVRMAGASFEPVDLERCIHHRNKYLVLQMIETFWYKRAPMRNVGLWLVSANLPDWVAQNQSVEQIAPGCYTTKHPNLLWVAANELPLDDKLVPFLIARYGEPLDKFMLWVVNRRPHAWVRELAQALPLTPSVRDKLLEQTTEGNTSTLCTTPSSPRRQRKTRNR